MTAACRSCGADALADARFCHRCGSQIVPADARAEYKQVTVLFADVVRSMDIAATVGTERWREIMADLVSGATRVVDRYGGTAEQFTGDGVMAVFGAPVALEDHALRACLAALAVQSETASLSSEVRIRDGVDLRLRVGLNSGEVIAGDMGPGSFGYTAIGEQVGMAQRMESVAQPGGVMLSASTARLVEDEALLSAPAAVRIKGASQPVLAFRLEGVAPRRRLTGRREPTLVGRQWELDALTGLLDRSVAGQGAVVGIVGSAGIGKSRLVRELTSRAVSAGVEVFSTSCQSHASDLPFHAVAELLRTAFGVATHGDGAARSRVSALLSDVDDEDVMLFQDLLGIADPAVALPKVEPAARRRRLTALVNAAVAARSSPAVFVIEDAHWIDDVSESMLVDFLAAIPRTPTLVLISYRPEYRGALTRLPGAQTIALAPLEESTSIALAAELLGSHASVADIAATINARAAGNPFFIEEIVRELAERGVLRGDRGDYECPRDISDITVPATLQAAIAARIDRLSAPAKRTLGAAAVIGSEFDPALLVGLDIEPAIDELVEAELIDQVSFTPRAAYAFHHPLIRTVAYESQLKADRADLHRRLAAAVETSKPSSLDENAAVIADHLEAAEDLPGAYTWHMRAAKWLVRRDIAAAQASWRRSRHIADRLPADDPDRMRKRIASRVLLCASAWRTEATLDQTGFDELRELCNVSGDRASLAMAMAGQSQALLFQGRYAESAGLVSDWLDIVYSSDDSRRITAFLLAASNVKLQAGQAAEGVRLAQRILDIVDGDPSRGSNLLVGGSPLALALGLRAAFGFCCGIPGWKDDFDQAVDVARGLDANSYASVIAYKSFAVLNSALLLDATAIHDTAEALKRAEQSGDDLALIAARCARGIALVNQPEPQSSVDDELTQLHEAIVLRRFSAGEMERFRIHLAKEKANLGDVSGAIDIIRGVLDFLDSAGEMLCRGPATMILVESLLRRAADGDIAEAAAAIARLEAVPTEPGFVLHELPLLRLRALMARADGDEPGYRSLADRYRARATELAFEGHMALADSMP